MPLLHLMAWMLFWQTLSVEGRIQGQPGVSRDTHSHWRAPLCSPQVLSSLPLSPASLHSSGCHITHGELQLFPAASLLKGHFACVFLSVVLAPLTVGVLTSALISKHQGLLGDDSGPSKCVFVSCLSGQGGCL